MSRTEELHLKIAALSKRYPVNAAIFEIAAAHKLTYRDLSKLLYCSMSRIESWGRVPKPNAAPLSALALLGLQLELPVHGLLKA